MINLCNNKIIYKLNLESDKNNLHYTIQDLQERDQICLLS